MSQVMAWRFPAIVTAFGCLGIASVASGSSAVLAWFVALVLAGAVLGDAIHRIRRWFR